MFLILYNSEKDEQFYKGIGNEQIVSDTFFKNGSMISKAIQRGMFRYKIPGYKYCSFSIWSKKKKYDVILVEALASKRDWIEYLLERYPNAKIILWYWNIVGKTGIDPKDEICRKCELWSFDKNDCYKYGMHYNTQFYNQRICLPKRKIVKDAIFVGGDKGRDIYLRELMRELKKQGLLIEFHIVKSDCNKDTEGIDYKKNISYKEVLEKIAYSKAIIDITIDNQRGLTLRPLEALFFEKKLITNNQWIREYEFYHPNNVFVLGYDSIDNINKFLELPYQKISEEIISYYDVAKWCKRFLQ